MSQRQIAAAAMHADASLDQKAPRALAFHRFPAAARNSVRLWEWDCFVKYLLICLFLHNSSKFYKFKHKSSTFYTPPTDLSRRSHSGSCPIMGMGLFRKIPDDPSRSTQFITIRRISTNFVLAGRPVASRSGAWPVRHPKSEIRNPKSNRHANR